MEGRGGPEVLQVKEVPEPEPGTGEVVVRVLAAGVCHHDLLDRAGRIPGAEPGRVLGHEIAGEVASPGGAPGLPEGQRVVVFNRVFCGRCRACLGGRQDLCRDSRVVGSGIDGGYAEYLKVPAVNLLPVPGSLAPEQAALLACPIGTAVRALAGVAGTAPGDTVLVTGAGGGLGLHGIQIARALGARVVAVTTSAGKEDAIRAAGADEVVVSPGLNYAAKVWALTGRQGLDIVMENVSTRALGESLRTLAPGGVAVVMGNVGVEPVAVDPGLLIGRRLRIVGSGNPLFRDVQTAIHLVASGRVTAQIAARLPFADAACAHAMAESRSATGRVVLCGW